MLVVITTPAKDDMKMIMTTLDMQKFMQKMFPSKMERKIETIRKVG